MPCVFQLWCAAGVNLSGGRAAHASELIKQARGSQSSLDQLEQENKVRRSALWLGGCVAYTLLRFLFACPGERGPGQGADAAGRDVQQGVGVHQL